MLQTVFRLELTQAASVSGSIPITLLVINLGKVYLYQGGNIGLTAAPPQANIPAGGLD